MRTQPPYHAPYVLWLLREGKASSLADLRAHFPDFGPTGVNMLMASLEALETAGLITAKPAISAVREAGSVWSDPGPVQNALKLSLTDLARSDLAQRLIVTPVLGRLFSTRYKSDILVLMPFTAELEPVYQDHIKGVAATLNKSVARADDFFTIDHIADEIWTAIIESGLIIADCTMRNPNVFYEIGLCHAIGKQTILITQNKDDIPFDLRHRRFIVYHYTPGGMKQFEETLKNTIVTVLQD